MAAVNYSVKNEQNLAAEFGSFADLTTTANTFVDVGSLGCTFYVTKAFVFVGATNTLSVKILGSIDGGATFPFEEVAAFDVASGATVTKTFTTPYTNVKVQVQPKVAASHGKLTTNWMLSVN